MWLSSINGKGGGSGREHPGITWDVKGKKDEHRIDYLFYKGPALKAIASESYKAHLGEPIELHGQKIPYPSDHGIVLTTFVVQESDLALAPWGWNQFSSHTVERLTKLEFSIHYELWHRYSSKSILRKIVSVPY